MGGEMERYVVMMDGQPVENCAFIGNVLDG